MVFKYFAIAFGIIIAILILRGVCTAFILFFYGWDVRYGAIASAIDVTMKKAIRGNEMSMAISNGRKIEIRFKCIERVAGNCQICMSIDMQQFDSEAESEIINILNNLNVEYHYVEDSSIGRELVSNMEDDMAMAGLLVQHIMYDVAKYSVDNTIHCKQLGFWKNPPDIRSMRKLQRNG